MTFKQKKNQIKYIYRYHRTRAKFSLKRSRYVLYYGVDIVIDPSKILSLVCITEELIDGGLLIMLMLTLLL